MRKLLFKLLLFILPFFALVEFYRFAKYRLDAENSVSKFLSVPKNIQFANTGSSHGGAISYDFWNDVNLVKFSFSKNTQPLIFDYEILRQYIKNIEKKGIILILCSYFEVDGIPQPETIESLDNRYYQFLYPKYLPDWNVVNFVKFRYLSVFTTKNSLKTMLKIFKDKISFNKDYNKADDYNFRKLSGLTLEKQKWEFEQAKRTFDVWFTRSGGTGFSYNKNILEKMINLCYENDLRPVILTTPIADGTNRLYEEDGFFPVFERFKSEILNEYPVIKWLDYSRNPDFSYNYDYFSDGHHMNEYGKEAFMSALKNDLENLGYLHN